MADVVPGLRLFASMSGKAGAPTGFIAFTEFSKMTASVGWSNDAALMMWHDVDKDGSGNLDRTEFLTFVNNPGAIEHIKRMEASMPVPGERLFNYMAGRSGAPPGNVAWEEFRKMTTSVGWAEDSAAAMWNNTDVDHSGQLDRREFMQFMCTPGVVSYIAPMEEKLPQALPLGWIVQTDAATGHEFYVHPATGTTQWDRPTAPLPLTQTPPPYTPPAPPAAPPPPAALPPGWVARSDPSGRTYYENTLTRETQWTAPGFTEHAAAVRLQSACRGSLARSETPPPRNTYTPSYSSPPGNRSGGSMSRGIMSMMGGGGGGGGGGERNDGPPSAMYRGSYREGGRNHPMDLRLNFNRGRISGDGQDDVGSYSITGDYDTRGTVHFWKKYRRDGKNVEYRGDFDPHRPGRLHGRWFLRWRGGSWEDDFELSAR